MCGSRSCPSAPESRWPRSSTTCARPGPCGVLLSATRADYGESHVERVRLVRALIDVAGLSIGRVREVVEPCPTHRRRGMGCSGSPMPCCAASPGGVVTAAACVSSRSS